MVKRSVNITVTEKQELEAKVFKQGSKFILTLGAPVLPGVNF